MFGDGRDTEPYRTVRFVRPENTVHSSGATCAVTRHQNRDARLIFELCEAALTSLFSPRAGLGWCDMGRRDNFVPIRRRRASSAPPTQRARDAAVEEPLAGDAPPIGTTSSFPMATAGLQHFAKQLWVPDYTQLFLMEFEQNLQAVGGGAFQLPPSSYRARLQGEAAERYDKRRMQQQRDQMAIALHANNQQHWSPSLLARSVTYFNLASEVIQKEEGRQRRLASRPTTFQFLRLMRDCRCAVRACVRSLACAGLPCVHARVHPHAPHHPALVCACMAGPHPTGQWGSTWPSSWPTRRMSGWA